MVAQPAPVAVEPAPAPLPVETANTGGTDEAMIAGILGALGLVAVGGVALAATRRRRRRALMAEQDYDSFEQEYVEESVAEPTPVVTPTPVVAATPAFTAPVVPATSFAAAAPAAAFTAPTVSAAATPSRTARANGDPIALPQEMPETFEERDALLKELVAAEPDKANPFTGVRARARRAKLIMQSLNRDFTSRKPRIDLSEYTNRWPALRGWQPATA